MFHVKHVEIVRRIESGNHPNIKQIEPDGQFIKIDQIRDLIAEMKMTGVEEGRKIYVIIMQIN